MAHCSIWTWSLIFQLTNGTVLTSSYVPLLYGSLYRPDRKNSKTRESLSLKIVALSRHIESTLNTVQNNHRELLDSSVSPQSH